MVKTRAQRVANDENGVTQSPPQVLSTPIRKPRKGAAGRSLNGTVRSATRSNFTNGKLSESEDSNKQTKSNASGLKKARLRNAAKQIKSQTQNTVILPDEISDSSARESVEPTENNQANGSIRGLSRETSKDFGSKRRKGVSHNTRSVRNNAISKTSGEGAERPNTSEPAAPQTNANLFNIFSRLTPRKAEPQPTNAGSDRVASSRTETDDKDTSSPEQQEQPRSIRPMKSKTKRQRVLQERGVDKQKAVTKKSPQSTKRKRVENKEDSDAELSDAPELKKKTARWSFKPNNEGNLTLLPRDEIDPEDVTVIFVEGDEAAKLISQEFERKKQVRFADRIAKQHAELTEEEKAAHQAKLEAQNLQITTQDFFGNSLARSGDMRALARRLDAGNMTMLERIESLTSNNDEELREDLARDLMELAFAIRAAGPQSKSISPVELHGSMQWDNPQENKENNSASASPEQAPLQIEAPPTPSQTADSHAGSNSTPGRLFASIRKIRSYLPFGGSIPDSIHSSPTRTEEMAKSPNSPTPAGRQGDEHMKSSAGQKSGVEAPDRQMSKPSITDNAQQESQARRQPQVPSTPESKIVSGGRAQANYVQSLHGNSSTHDQKLAAEKKSADMVQEMSEKWNSSGLNRLPKTPGSLKRKIGSEAYPLTADGKIPRPGPNAYGINDEYFYGAESSSDSEEEEEPIRKRRRVLNNGNSSKAKSDNTRLTKSAPRPTTTRPPIKTPTPRIYAAPNLSDSDSDEGEDEPAQISSVERRDQEREKLRAERLKNAADAHKPKTPSRLRQMATVPPSPIDIRSRLQKHFKGQGTEGVLSVFAHI